MEHGNFTEQELVQNGDKGYSGVVKEDEVSNEEKPCNLVLNAFFISYLMGSLMACSIRALKTNDEHGEIS